MDDAAGTAREHVDHCRHPPTDMEIACRNVNVSQIVHNWPGKIISLVWGPPKFRTVNLIEYRIAVPALKKHLDLAACVENIDMTVRVHSESYWSLTDRANINMAYELKPTFPTTYELQY